MEAPLDIFPTGIRVKLPKTLSYPLGAELISKALDGIPQARLIAIDFWFHSRKSLQNPFLVLSGGYGTRGWQISVGPVPRPLRHIVREALVAEALPRLRQWFLTSQNTAGRCGGHYLAFLFDVDVRELRTEEHSTIEWNTARVAVGR